MNIALWIVQILLALQFLIVGSMKAFFPLGTIAKPFRWVPTFPPVVVRLIGVCEILGVIGILVPPLTHIFPWLAIAAAVGFMVVVFSGALLHFSRREYTVIGPNILFFLLAAFVVYGRLMLVPF